ncbi:MAG: hypothetical protein K0R57_6298 [Paenibacillaceae bacterium]|jgi:superfamily I DNA and/or RNA helicase|nr:hypothetical protein [Paenibacillaceae bacterium]
MNHNHLLIMLKGEDKTAEVLHYSIEKKFVSITLHNSDEPVLYLLKDVGIYENPNETVITEDIAVYLDGQPLNNVRSVQDFGVFARVNYQSTSRVYKRKRIEIHRSGAQTPQASAIMAYWRSISKHVKNKDDEYGQEAFLGKEFDKLGFVHPQSVLSQYLNAMPIKCEETSNTGLIFPFKYNLSQKKAMQQALQSTISIIEGPPGTGKTQTILNILSNLTVMRNKTVAVVSGNNAAVENVREKLEREGYHFLTASLGNYENKVNFFAHPPAANVTGWQSDESEEELLEKIINLDSVIDELMATEREMAQLKQKLAAYQLEQQHFERFYMDADVDELGKMSFYRQTPERILEFMKDSFLAVESKNEKSFIYKFKLFFKHGFTRFRQLELQGTDVILIYQRQFYTLRVDNLKRQISELEHKLASQSFRELVELHQQCSKNLFRHKLHAKYCNLEQTIYDLKNYRSNFKLFKSFIKRYPIILSTAHSLRNSVSNNYMFDYCIMDESSQIDLLTGVLALSCCRHAIIVGDTKQLPQIVDMEIEGKLEQSILPDSGGPYDYFRHNILSSMFMLYEDTVPRVILREHYRCRPEIIQFNNMKYYDDELIVFTEPRPESALLLYKTVLGNHMRDGCHGKSNQRELDVIEQEILAGLSEDNEGHPDIGIVTPYRNQANKAAKQYESIESDTIHKYQGREKPVMILTTVLDRTKYGRMGMKFVNDPCKINVAVSRAQNKFILVTDQEAFRRYGNEVGDLMRYMEYSSLDPQIVESQVTSVFDLLYREYSAKLRVFRNSVSLFNKSKYQSENIMDALLTMILQESVYRDFMLANQVLLIDLFPKLNILSDEEKRFVRQRSSVDFVIYHKFDRTPVLAIEVDGYTYHENKPEQLKRDEKKNNIFEKFGVPIARFSTTGSGEEDKIRKLFNLYLAPEMQDK